MHRHLLACALTLCAVPAFAGQVVNQQIQIGGSDMGPMQMLRPGQQAKTGTGKLRGKVIASDTGVALRRAQVRISSPDIGTKTALTDAQGRYEFKDLPAGRFTVAVSKSGFVTMQYGQSRPYEPGRPIELVDAQIMDKADLALPRGSVLSGRVVDEFGEPVADANVTAMRMQYASGRRRLVPSGRNSQSDDRGQFRIYGLSPGEYYVSASLRTLDAMVFDLLGGGGGGPVGSNSNSGYAATYFPGTPNPAEAQRVTLAVGQEMSSVDIALQPVRLAKITGSAVTSDGKPMAGAMVMLLPTMKDAVGFMPGGTSRTDKAGQFTLSNVVPGEYALQVQSMAGLMNAAGRAMVFIGGGDSGSAQSQTTPQENEFATASVTVTGDDITGMALIGTRGAKATGKLVFDGGPKPDNLATIRMMAQPTDSDQMAPAASAFGATTVKDSGDFEIEGLSGGRLIRLMNPPKGWSVKSVQFNGQDITDKGYEFKPGEDVDGFEVTLTTQSQGVTGAVTNEKNEPLKDCTVVVFADDPAKWTLPSNRWIASARPDQDGNFKVNNLPAGSYMAIAVDYVEQGGWSDPDWLTRASKRATRFTLSEGSTKTLDLRLASQ